MCTVKRKYTRRISVWVLVFALLLSVLTSSLLLPVHADSWMNDRGNDARQATEEAGDAVRDAGDATRRAVDDMMDMDAAEGRVRDDDGIIGNEATERSVEQADTTEESGGWLGWVIAVVVALIALVLIVVLIPKKRAR